jgi:hypothetical protein
LIQGLNYARGPLVIEHAEPASNFSKGDLLMLTSVSSVSRIAELMPSGADIYGVALCDSTQSISKKVPVCIPQADTIFVASFNSASGSAISVGAELDINYAVANGRQFVTTSTDSVRAVVTRGVVGLTAMDQSVHSQVEIKLIRHGGNIELS